MSIFSKILGTAAKVANIAYGIIKTALPILKALRPAVEEVDEAFVFIEKGIAEGGVVADDWLDKNIDTIIALETVSGRGEAVFQKLGSVAAKLRIYSQEESPDTITEEEALDLGRELYEAKLMIASWSGDLEVAITKLEAAE